MALLDTITAEPEPALTLVPVPTNSAPPRLFALVGPIDNTTAPPTPELPAPTTTLMGPPEPAPLVLVCSVTQPLLPENVVPERSNSVPEAPTDAAFAVVIDTEPEPALMLEPD